MQKNVNVCDICTDKSKDYVLVRYYELLVEDKVPFDSLNKKLDCIHVTLESYGSSNDGKGAENEYAL